MEQLSGQDASFLYFETPTAHMHVAWLSVYDQSTAPKQPVRFRDITDNIRKRLHLARCFRRRLVEVPFNADHPYWIEDGEFDLEFHVRHIALPPPGDWSQLCRQAARLHSYPLNREHPLWEVTVISGLQAVAGLPDGAFATLLKVHQSAVDGASGAAVSEVLHDLTRKPSGVSLPDKPWVPEDPPSPLELGMRTAGNNFLQPFRFAEVLSRTAPVMQSAAEAQRATGPGAAGPVPRTRFNRAVTAHRVLDGREYPLEALRDIKARLEGATVNDVVLALVGGALRRYLADHGELPAEPLVALAPVNVAAEPAGEGTRLAPMTAALGTHLADPMARLAAVRDSCQRQSETLARAVGARLMTDYARYVPAQLASLAARQYTTYGMASRGAPAFNCVVTNVPGPQQPLYMCGARLLKTFGMGPLFDGVGLTFPVFSYDGTLAVAVNSCRELLPDPERLADCLDESFRDLVDAEG